MHVYGERPSVDYPIGTRLRDDGISCADLRDLYNDFRKDAGLQPLRGTYLDCPPTETAKQFSTQVYERFSRSLKDGELPIICLRSQVAAWNAVRKDFEWKSLVLHVVVLKTLSQRSIDGSFSFNFLDSLTGSEHTLFVYPDVRKFFALKGSVWLSPRPFLLVSGSNVDLNTSETPWFERTIIYLNYAILKE